jgi:hypothetical protein
MSTFERTLVTLLVSVPLAIAAACNVTGVCLRNSDCDDGLVCIAEACVVPPAPPSDGGSAASEASVVDMPDTSTPSTNDATATTTPDAAADAGPASNADAGQVADTSTTDAVVPAADATGE